MLVEGCPGLLIDPDSALAYRLFHLAYSAFPIPPKTVYLRHLTFAETLDFPAYFIEAFQIIEAELYHIQAK